jgi:hypothetical protein
MCRSNVAPATAGPLAAILSTIAAVLADEAGVDPSSVRIGPVDFGEEEEPSPGTSSAGPG